MSFSLKRFTRLAQLAFALLFSLAAHAQQEIKIGALYPLTGAAASTGAELKNALELAAEVVNSGAKGIPGLPFSAGGGLPNLKGRK
jgi:branched-chain amino acid transport system substrate-binding protein